MRSTFKTVFYVNGSKEKNGIVPIMGRVTINGTIAQFSCKQRISKDLEVSIAIRRLARRTSVLPTDKGKPTPPQAFGNKSHSSLWRFLHAPLTLMLKTPQ